MPSSLSRGALAAAALLCGAMAAQAAIFDPLFVVTKVVGDVRVERPNGTESPVLRDHAYPYGSRIVIPQSLSEEAVKAALKAGVEPDEPHVFVRLANDFVFRLGPGTDAKILDQSTGSGEDLEELKVFDLLEGSIDTRISAAVKKNGGTLDEKAEKNLSAVVVRTPVGECSRLAERNTVTVKKDPATPGYYDCLFVSNGGYMEIHGPQYDLDHLKRATRIRIDGNMDFTSITPESGEFTGTFEKGADNNEKVFFRTRCVGKIWRSHAQVGGRLVVAVMVSFPDGSRKTYQYLEGQTGVDAGADATTNIDAGSSAESGSWEEEESGSGDGWGSGDDEGGDSGDGWGGGDDDWGSDDWL